MSQPTFEINPSGEIQQLSAHHNVSLMSDLPALGALAAVAEIELPDKPRVLLLNKGQMYHTPETILLKYGPSEYEQAQRQYEYHPTHYGENDIVVRLLRRNELTESAVTASIARALVDRRQAVQKMTGIRRGLGIGTTGLLLGGTAEIGFHNHAVGIVGGMLFLAGVGLAAHYCERGEAPLPDNLAELEPPIRLKPRSSAQ